MGVADETALAVDDEYRAYYDRIRKRRGATALLAGLKQRGVRVGLLSNNEPLYVSERLRQDGIATVFDVVFEAAPQMMKPNGAAFLAVARSLGPDVGRTVMVGDNLLMDVLPALDSGYAHAYWMTASRRPAPAGATKVRTCGALAALLLG